MLLIPLPAHPPPPSLPLYLTHSLGFSSDRALNALKAIAMHVIKIGLSTPQGRGGGGSCVDCPWLGLMGSMQCPDALIVRLQVQNAVMGSLNIMLRMQCDVNINVNYLIMMFIVCMNTYNLENFAAKALKFVKIM